MVNNVTREDLDGVVEFLQGDMPKLTQGEQVSRFEQEWSDWLGVKHSVFVNSGASANLLTMSALKEIKGLGEVIVPAITWVSDIASVMQCGFTPVFVDINPRTLGMDNAQVLGHIGPVPGTAPVDAGYPALRLRARRTYHSSAPPGEHSVEFCTTPSSPGI